jgi:hypothetical protein
VAQPWPGLSRFWPLQYLEGQQEVGQVNGFDDEAWRGVSW